MRSFVTHARIAAVVALVIAVACGADGATNPSDASRPSATPFGVWILRSVAGQPLPYFSIVSDTFTLNPDGTYVEVEWSLTDTTNVAYRVNGKWFRVDSTVFEGSPSIYISAWDRQWLGDSLIELGPRGQGPIGTFRR